MTVGSQGSGGKELCTWLSSHILIWNATPLWQQLRVESADNRWMKEWQDKCVERDHLREWAFQKSKPETSSWIFVKHFFFLPKKHKAQTFQGLSAKSINAKPVDTFYADEMWWGKSWNWKGVAIPLLQPLLHPSLMHTPCILSNTYTLYTL